MILTLGIFYLFYTYGLCYVDAKSNLTNDGAEAANAGGRGRRWRRRHRQWNGTFHSTLMSRFISSRHEKTGAADYRGSAIMLRRARRHYYSPSSHFSFSHSPAHSCLRLANNGLITECGVESGAGDRDWRGRARVEFVLNSDPKRQVTLVDEGHDRMSPNLSSTFNMLSLAFSLFIVRA